MHYVKSVEIRSYFWSVFSCIWTMNGYSVQKQENTDQKQLRIWELFTQWCSMKEISKFVSNAFMLVYSSILNSKSCKILNSYQSFKKILQNFGRLTKFWLYHSIIKWHKSKNCGKSFATYDFLALCTKLPHDKLKSKLSSIVKFVVKGGGKTLIRLSDNGAECWGLGGNKRGTYF